MKAPKGLSQNLCNRKVMQIEENIGKGDGATYPLYQHISGKQAGCQGATGSVRHSVSEVDCQLSVDHAPVLAPARPFLSDVHHGKVQHLEQAVIGGENGLGLGHLPELAVKALNSVSGVDQPAHLLRVLEISTQIGPIAPPGAGDFWVFLVPMFRENLQRVQGGSFVYRRVYRLEVGHERFQILVGHISGGIADLVDDAVLHLCFREYSLYGS